MKKTKRAFTLIELIITIAILAILAAIAVPTVNHLIEQAKDAEAKANVDTIHTAFTIAMAKIKPTDVVDRMYIPNTNMNALDQQIFDELNKSLSNQLDGKYLIIYQGRANNSASAEGIVAGDIQILFCSEGWTDMNAVGYKYHNGEFTKGKLSELYW